MLQGLGVSRNVYGISLSSGQLQQVRVLSRQELQWNDTHSHQVGTMNPLKRFCYYSFDTLSTTYQLKYSQFDTGKLTDNTYIHDPKVLYVKPNSCINLLDSK